jgi:hypothetical protein
MPSQLRGQMKLGVAEKVMTPPPISYRDVSRLADTIHRDKLASRRIAILSASVI